MQVIDRSELEAEFDPRLSEVWLSVFSSGIEFEELTEALSWFLRMAYLQGYEDALTEPERGQLYKRLGLQAPRPITTRSHARKGASR